MPLPKYHHLPSARCRIMATMIMIALFSLMPRNIQAAPSQNSRVLKDIRNKMSATKGRARKYERAARTVDREITGLRRNLVTAAGKIQQTEQDVYSTENHLDLLNNQQKNLNNALKSRYRQMSKTLAAMQRLSRQPAELVAFRPETAINSLRSASLLKILQPELKKRATIIHHDITKLTLVRQKIIKDRQDLRRLLAALTSKQIKMNQLLAARRLKQKTLHDATRQERRKLKQFAARAKNLQDLIARIDRENKARAIERAAIIAARRLSPKPDHITGQTRSRLDLLLQRDTAFSRDKGRMPLPARGAIRRTFGAKNPEGQLSEGITIHTLPLATVVSPHEGRIVFAGKFRSYGLLLIISHGPKYHTLLAGMSRLDAVVGQWVLKGEPVGQMAAVPEKKTGRTNRKLQPETGQTLYVELRRMGKPINPLPWIMARDRKVL